MKKVATLAVVSFGRAVGDQSLRCPHDLGAQSLCWFCHVAAQLGRAVGELSRKGRRLGHGMLTGS